MTDMPDPYLDALLAYQTETAPAYEVIRRARARLQATLRDLPDVGLEAVAFATMADHTEPNRAEFAVEAAAAATEQPVEPAMRTPPAKAKPESRRAASPKGDRIGAARGSSTQATPPARRKASGGVEARRAAGPYVCSECGREFEFPNGRARHVAAAHATGDGRVKDPAPDVTRARAARSEKFLCHGCSAEFATRERRDEHQANAHPPAPRGQPVGMQPRGGAQYGERIA